MGASWKSKKMKKKLVLAIFRFIYRHFILFFLSLSHVRFPLLPHTLRMSSRSATRSTDQVVWGSSAERGILSVALYTQRCPAIHLRKVKNPVGRYTVPAVRALVQSCTVFQHFLGIPSVETKEHTSSTLMSDHWSALTIVYWPLHLQTELTHAHEEVSGGGRWWDCCCSYQVIQCGRTWQTVF